MSLPLCYIGGFMTITKAIGVVDNIRPNQISTAQKTEWILAVEKRVKNEIYLTHKHDGVDFTNFNSSTIATDTLYVPEPYSEIYTLFLCGMVDFYHAEYDRYNNDVDLFNKTFDDYAQWYNRNNEPLSATLKY